MVDRVHYCTLSLLFGVFESVLYVSTWYFVTSRWHKKYFGGPNKQFCNEPMDHKINATSRSERHPEGGGGGTKYVPRSRLTNPRGPLFDIHPPSLFVRYRLDPCPLINIDDDLCPPPPAVQPLADPFSCPHPCQCSHICKLFQPVSLQLVWPTFSSCFLG